MRNSLSQIVFGHDQAVKLLSQAIQARNFPQSLLLTGMPQLGKATLARALAMALICRGNPKPCGECPDCKKIQHGNHPDIVILDGINKDGSRETLKIEQIRELQRDLLLRPHESQYKIAVICDFERATPSAANALLKTLEEPPAHVILILTAQSVNQLLPTIVSRCQITGLHPVSPQAMANMLQTRFQASAEQANLLSHLAQGRPGWAVEAMTNPDMLEQRRADLADLIDLIGKGYASRLAYAQLLAKATHSPMNTLNLWLSWWRDVLLINSGSSQPVTNIDFSDTLTRFAQSLSAAQITNAIKQTYSTLQNFDYNVNSRLNLEVLLLNLPIIKAQR